jgi:hypothetical protein
MNKRTIKRVKYTAAFGVLSIIALGAAAYMIFGEQIVRNMYQGTSVFFLNGIISSRDVHSPDFYLGKADLLFYKTVFFALYSLVSLLLLTGIKGNAGRISLAVILFAIAVAVNSQFTSYLDPYVINDDVCQHTWWMRQFRQPGLFQEGLLYRYASSIQPWGYTFLYYMLSFFMDPVVTGKVLPPLLLALSAFYFFRIMMHLTGDRITSFLGSAVFSVTPEFIRQMSGGHARAFAYPLIIMFLYYLIKKRYAAVFLVITLQTIFYPVAALISGGTFFLSFIRIRDTGHFFGVGRKKMYYFILTGTAGAVILFSKQYISHEPEIGKPVTREYAEEKIEFHNERWPLLPTPPALSVLGGNTGKGVFLLRAFRNTRTVKALKEFAGSVPGGLLVVLITGVMLFIAGKNVKVPPEIFHLLISGIIFYKVADIFFLKLYSPRRYLEYSAPVAGAVIFVLLISALILATRNIRLRGIFQIAVFLTVAGALPLSSGEALSDMSPYRNMYDFLAATPRGAVIAGHPELMDAVPVFAQRNVIVSRELSVPLFGAYWEKVKRRTFDVFGAYYSENPEKIKRVGSQYGLDYIVADRNHFREGYLGQNKIYFEPFGSYIKNITSGERSYALLRGEAGAKVYDDGRILIIRLDDPRAKGSDK